MHGLATPQYQSSLGNVIPLHRSRRERAFNRGTTPFWSPNDTYHDVMSRCLSSLCDGVGFAAAQRDAAVALIHTLLASWTGRAIGREPEGESDITDEHFPLEFSVAFEDGVPEVRVLFEAQADEFVQSKLWKAGWDVGETLAQGNNVSLDRLHAVADLFEPTDPDCRYAMWHCVCFSPAGPPKFKVYLNPLAQGAEQAPAIIREALTRLGFSTAIQDVFGNSAAGELRFFSLDLSSLNDARVKIYRVHHNATRDEISDWLRCVPSYDERFVQRFWDQVSGPSERFSQLPVSTYVSLNSQSDRPNTATIHFPVRSYADDDLEVYGRMRNFLEGSDLELYERALASFVNRPLSAGVGLQSYVAVRLHPGAQRTTLYLSPEAYDIPASRRGVRDELQLMA
jgi:DMATS type aromatic prenyltransferase